MQEWFLHNAVTLQGQCDSRAEDILECRTAPDSESFRFSQFQLGNTADVF